MGLKASRRAPTQKGKANFSSKELLSKIVRIQGQNYLRSAPSHLLWSAKGFSHKPLKFDWKFRYIKELKGQLIDWWKYQENSNFVKTRQNHLSYSVIFYNRRRPFWRTRPICKTYRQKSGKKRKSHRYQKNCCRKYMISNKFHKG